MKNKWSFPFLLSCFLLVGFNLLKAEEPSDVKRILEAGVLTVGMYCEDVPPFFVKNAEGDFWGMDVEIARDIGKRLGVKVVFNRDAKTFDDVVDLVKNRKADVAISLLSKTLKRAIHVRFSDPYIMLYQTLVINRLKAAGQRRSKDPYVFLNHPNVSIGVIEGTSYVGFAKDDFPLAKLVLYQNWNSAIEDVIKGTIFAVLYDEVEVKNWHKDHPDSALYVQTVIRKDKNDPIAFAVHWEDTHFLSWLNMYLEIIQKDGTLDSLKEKYLKVGND